MKSSCGLFPRRRSAARFVLVLLASALLGHGQIPTPLAYSVGFDPGRRRVVKLGGTKLTELDRTMYFRVHTALVNGTEVEYPPGSGTKITLDQALAQMQAFPGRQFGPVATFKFSDWNTAFSGQPLYQGKFVSAGESSRDAHVARPNLDYPISGPSGGWGPELCVVLANGTRTAAVRSDRYPQTITMMKDYLAYLSSVGALGATTYPGLRPAYFSPLNEPDSDSAWGSHGGGATAYATFLRDLATSIGGDSRPGVIQVAVTGPVSAWPFPALAFGDWTSASPTTYERATIDLAGDKLDFYEFHLYSKGNSRFDQPPPAAGQPQASTLTSLFDAQRDGATTVWDYGRLDGFLDLVQAYQHKKWNVEKPVIISEFGRQGVHPQFGPWATYETDADGYFYPRLQEYKSWLYMTTVTRQWLTYFDRPDIHLTIPFILGVSDSGYAPFRGQTLYTRDLNLRPIPTRMVDFYRFFSDLPQDARRIPNWNNAAQGADHDILVRTFAKGNEVYLVIHNGHSHSPTADRSVSLTLNNNGAVATTARASKRLRWNGAVPTSPSASDPAPGSGSLSIQTSYVSEPLTGPIVVNGEETVIVRQTLASVPTVADDRVEHWVYSQNVAVPMALSSGVYRATATLTTPTYPAALTSATLKLGLARDGGFPANPTLKVNGVTVTGLYIDDSDGVAAFHRVVAVPVPLANLVVNGTNTIVVESGNTALASGAPTLVTAKLEVTYNQPLNTN